jgi:hypothetical protein
MIENTTNKKISKKKNLEGNASGDTAPANVGEHTASAKSSKTNINRRNRRRSFIKPTRVIRQPKFGGKCEALKVHIYDCSDTRQADIFVKPHRS